MSARPLATATPSLRFALLPLALLAAAPFAARAADPVLEWSRIVSETPAGGPPQVARVHAMATLAMHDALNAIDARYESYAVIPAAAVGASPDAAVATAARDVLVAAAPAQAATVQQKYAAFLATLAPCPVSYPNCIVDGVATGANAASAMLALRVNDGSASPDVPYAAPLALGVYQPTPGQPTPRNEGWQYVRTFGIHGADQFRAGDSEILHIGSDVYARDYEEVRRVGSYLVRGNLPDSAESETARFWPTGTTDWHTIARGIATAKDMDTWQRARLFALVNMGQADAAITVYDTKYYYRFWRPVTAIRWIDDGDPRTVHDPGWNAFMGTPPYPDYTCGLTTAAGAGTEVLRRFFGTDAVSFTATAKSPAIALPPPFAGPLPAKDITRTFATLRDAEDSAVDARVYGGMHFRTGCVQGVRHGAKVGRFVTQHYLRPLK